MRALIQRVNNASVTINGVTHSSIGHGILVLLGVKEDDTETDVLAVAEKCSTLRIFDDAEGKMNLSVINVHGEVMVVSQFTLYGETRKGTRPSYSGAARADLAESLYNRFIVEMKDRVGQNKVRSGVFKAMMKVESINDGPVTVLVESKEKQ